MSPLLISLSRAVKNPENDPLGVDLESTLALRKASIYYDVASRL
jgi:hypothetical protein